MSQQQQSYPSSNAEHKHGTCLAGRMIATCPSCGGRPRQYVVNFFFFRSQRKGSKYLYWGLCSWCMCNTESSSASPVVALAFLSSGVRFASQRGQESLQVATNHGRRRAKRLRQRQGTIGFGVEGWVWLRGMRLKILDRRRSAGARHFHHPLAAVYRRIFSGGRLLIDMMVVVVCSPVLLSFCNKCPSSWEGIKFVVSIKNIALPDQSF